MSSDLSVRTWPIFASRWQIRGGTSTHARRRRAAAVRSDSISTPHRSLGLTPLRKSVAPPPQQAQRRRSLGTPLSGLGDLEESLPSVPLRSVLGYTEPPSPHAPRKTGARRKRRRGLEHWREQQSGLSQQGV